MKIVYYSKPCFGDCDFPLLKALMASGNQVTTIYTLSPHSLRTTIFNINEQIPDYGIYPATAYPELANYSEYMPLDNVYIANDPVGRFCFRSVLQELRVFRFIISQKPEVVNLVEDPTPLFAFLLWFLRNKLVVTIHDGRPHMGKSSRKGRFCRKILKYYVQRFILLNQGENCLFEKGYGVDPTRIFNSHLGYYELLNLYGNKYLEKQNYILFFGRISEYKGIDYLLKAIEIVHVSHPGVKLIIAGSGTFHFDVSYYKSLDYIEFRNRYIDLDELADLIRGALFTVCPYIEATQSGVVYSSFALNTPVIATEVGGLPEMIDNGKTGMIIPPSDISSLANAIVSLLNDSNLRIQYSNSIKQSAENGRGSWRKVAEEYIKVYSIVNK